MDRDDPLRQRVVGAGEAERLTVQMNRAGVRLVDAGDDLGERRLAGAVLADESADAARLDGEVDAAQRAARRRSSSPRSRQSSSMRATLPAQRSAISPHAGIRRSGALVMSVGACRALPADRSSIASPEPCGSGVRCRPRYLPVTCGSLANSAAFSLVRSLVPRPTKSCDLAAGEVGEDDVHAVIAHLVRILDDECVDLAVLRPS